MTSHCARTHSLPHISTLPESKHQTYNARYSPLHLRRPFYLLGNFSGANCYCGTTVSIILLLLSTNCHSGTTVSIILLLLSTNCHTGTTVSIILLLLSTNCHSGTTVSIILLLLSTNCHTGTTVSNILLSELLHQHCCKY